MNYKFIGTDTDLVDNGFTLLNNQYYKASRGNPTPCFPKEIICIDKNNVIEINFSMNMPNKWNLKQLIEKGLVVEVDE